MKVTIYWATRKPDIIKRIRERFRLPTYISVNYETECEIRDEDLSLLHETERRGFIQIRNK